MKVVSEILQTVQRPYNLGRIISVFISVCKVHIDCGDRGVV